jgi:hypothetical protein
MSSELLGSAQNVLKGNLGGAWDITNGYQDAYTDLGIARRFGGAAAAYSLRDIGAMNGPVVRVRRDNDDEEEDFTANQVSSGALEDWVNGKFQNTLPADVATAAAAYSLRKVKASYSGNAVQVRRGSDDVEVNVAFDSDSKVSLNSSISTVSGSTTATDLNGFLNEILTVGTAVNGTGSFDNYTFTANGNTGFDADNSAGGIGSAGFPYSFASGDVMTVRYTVTNFSSTSGLSPQIRGTTGTNSVTQVAVGGTIFTANGTYTDTLTATADGTHLMFADGNTGSYTISDFQIVSHTQSAFVHTWYDQAGSNDAVQETAANQPKIAENGALLSSLDYSDGGKFLQLSSTVSVGEDVSLFGVATKSTGTDILFDARTGAGAGFRVFEQSDVQKFTYDATTVSSSFNPSAGNNFLITAIQDGSNAKIAVNANTFDTAAETTVESVTPTPVIGGKSFTTVGADNWEGTISEIIFYTSDQTDNRFKIESNINNYYGLYNDANEFSGNPTAEVTPSAITLTNVSKTGFTAEINATSGAKQINFPLLNSLVSGDDYFVSFDYTSTNTSNTVGVKPRTAALGSASNDSISATNSGFYGGTGDAVDNGFDVNDTATILSFQTTSSSFTFTVSNLKVSRIARNGFVETWYDQSANLRDAIQGTATNQPSIVENGGIVKVNSKPAITFNGSDNFLEVDGSSSAVAYSFSPSGDMGMFIVSKQFTGNVVDSRDGAGDGIFLQQASSDTTRFRYNGDGSIDITATRDAQHFSTMTLDGTTLSASVDGGTAGTDTVTAGVSTTSNLVIGKAFSGNNSNFVDGEIQEAIFYENNKTSEKSDIETDIDNFYSIT